MIIPKEVREAMTRAYAALSLTQQEQKGSEQETQQDGLQKGRDA